MSKRKSSKTISKQTSRQIKVDKNYNLFAINFEGTILTAIRNEYAKRVKEGQRKKVFIVDLDASDEPVVALADIPEEGATKRKSVRKSTSAEPEIDKTKNQFTRAIKSISQCEEDYDTVMRNLDLMKRFDLLTYWKETAPKAPTATMAKKSRSVISKKGGKTLAPIREIGAPVVLKRKETTKIGKKENLAKKIFIEDEPENSKLYISLLGGEDVYDFYLEVLSQNEPLLAIIYFTPQRCFYDTMSMKNMRKHIQLIRMVNCFCNNLRRSDKTKPVGIFQYDLPPLSECLSKTKYSRDIYDQLTWYLYDIELLYQQYMDQYKAPFNEMDVSMPEGMVLRPACLSLERPDGIAGGNAILEGNDTATIAFYLDCLLDSIEQKDSTTIIDCGKTEETCTGKETSSSSALFIVNSELNSIILDDCNDLLKSWFTYSDDDEANISSTYCRMRKMLPICGENNVDDDDDENEGIDGGFCGGDISKDITKKPLRVHVMPKYCEALISNDSVQQRINQLSVEYDSCQQLAIGGRHTLHYFHRRNNIVVETVRKRRLSTKLCFRDFCDYLSGEFIKALEMYEQEIENAGSNEGIKNQNCQTEIKIDPKLFIRRDSIKARNIENTLSDLAQVTVTPLNDPELMQNISGTFHQILPDSHPLLNGYNLGDTLQELTENSFIFRFSGGFFRFKSDAWLHSDKSTGMLQISFKHGNIYLQQSLDGTGIIPSIRIVSLNDISCYVFFDQENRFPKLYINWPIGLTITRNIFPTNVEQKHLNQSVVGEMKRIYTVCGSIIVFYKNDRIRILKSNGTIFEVYPDNIENEDEEQSVNEALDVENESSLMKSIIEDIRFINRLCKTYNLKSRHYHLTTSTGRNLEIRNNKVVSENHKYLLFEWADYFLNEWYAEREDGLRMVWTSDSLKCYFADGTLITSKVNDTEITLDENGGEEEEMDIEMEVESKKLSSASTLSEPICCDICDDEPADPCTIHRDEEQEQDECKPEDELENDTDFAGENEEQGDYDDDMVYVMTTMRSFLMQNKNYATVGFSDGDKIQIYSPDDVTVEMEEPFTAADELNSPLNITEMAFKITIGKQIHLNLTPTDCWLQVCMQVDRVPCDFTSMIGFSSMLTEVFDQMVGKIMECIKHLDCDRIENKYILSANDIGGGFEFFSKSPDCLMPCTAKMCEGGLSETEWNYCRHETVITMVRGLRNFKDLMTMPIESMKIDMEKFQRKIHEQCPKNELPSKLRVRVFVTAPYENMEVNEILPFLDSINVPRLKSCHTEYAVANFLSPLQEEKRKEKTIERWQCKHQEHSAMLKERGRRLVFYKVMMKHKAYPKYQDFEKLFNYNVKDIDIDMLQRLLCCPHLVDELGEVPVGEAIEKEIQSDHEESSRKGSSTSSLKYSLSSVTVCD